METLLLFVRSVWSTTEQMAPYLLFGFALAGLLSQLITPETVERHLGRRGVWATLKASLLGVPLPLCSCGVIPVAASLRTHGASRGATTAFLISTPQTGVDSVLATYGMLGPVVAVFRVVAAFLSGLLGGVLVDRFGDEASGSGLANKADSGCAGKDEPKGLVPALRYGFLTLPSSIGKALAVGVLIAGALGALVPDGAVPASLGGGIAGMLGMMALGVPMYVCATASIPVAAALVAKGVSPGAALVFLMTGPATNAATIGVLWRALGKRAAALYVGVVGVSALASGLLLDGLFGDAGMAQGAAGSMHMLPPWVGTVSAVLLVGLVVIPRLVRCPASNQAEAGERELELEVSGMSCQHCAETARKAALACGGVRSVQVDLGAGRVRVAGREPDAKQLQAALDAVGFAAKPTEIN